ncbi:SRPBCC domain-containing protein [Streptomyces sp. NPDC003247]|uniref:SRPBCC domain-containing protein n=1 Tax=Streptomyces sp. NPDC003247 TaxID=3364677 RepID=UPI00368C8091
MEHEVFVPVPVERLRAALADPAQVARAVPGLQQDAGSEPVAGRLKVRVGGHTITYRGTLRVTAREDGTHAVEGDASEVRGTGTVEFALTVRLGASEDGTTLGFDGTASADGRIAQQPGEAVDGAVVRLLNRFAENLGAGAGAGAAAEAADAGAAPEPERPLPADEPPAVPDTGIPRSDLADDIDGGADAVDDGGDLDDIDGLDDVDGLGEEDEADEVDEADEMDGLGGLPPSSEPPAEAAHARRTMIGRSAEEVDHAPPRGRYAPVPAAQTVTPNSTLRWAGPAAALVVASAIVVGRALRRRR